MGLLSVVNATHAWYQWTRAGCNNLNESVLDPAMRHVNLDGSDYTTESYAYGDDNSAQAESPKDGVWIVRDRQSACGSSPVRCNRSAPGVAPPRQRGSSWWEKTPADEGDEPADEGGECVRGSASGVLAGTAVLFLLLGVLLGAGGVQFMRWLGKQDTKARRREVLREVDVIDLADASPARQGTPQPVSPAGRLGTQIA